jgi:hypothetical protein
MFPPDRTESNNTPACKQSVIDPDVDDIIFDMYHDNQADWDAGAPRRILGMKIWQIALLGGMAALDCLVLVVGAVIILGGIPSAPGSGSVAGGSSTSTPVVAPLGPTLAPSPSLTPITMAFQFPTYTPYGTPAETFTLTPSFTGLMDGWVKFTVPEIEVWLPGSFTAGKPQTEADAIIASLKEKGAYPTVDWDWFKEVLESQSEGVVLWAFDSYQGNPEAITDIAFMYGGLNAGEPLIDIATHLVGAMSDDYIFVEQQSSVRHPEYEAVMVMLEAKDSGEGPTQMAAFYVLRAQNVVWGILCETAKDEMNGRLPIFNRIVESFRVR